MTIEFTVAIAYANLFDYREKSKQLWDCVNEKKGKRMKNSVDLFKSVKMMHHYISRNFINFET